MRAISSEIVAGIEHSRCLKVRKCSDTTERTLHWSQRLRHSVAQAEHGLNGGTVAGDSSGKQMWMNRSFARETNATFIRSVQPSLIVPLRCGWFFCRGPVGYRPWARTTNGFLYGEIHSFDEYSQKYSISWNFIEKLYKTKSFNTIALCPLRTRNLVFQRLIELSRPGRWSGSLATYA